MMKSYLAVIDEYGLRALHEEHEHTYEILQHQISRLGFRFAFVAWAELDSDLVRVIRLHLAQGHTREAWLLLEGRSRQVGRLTAVYPPQLA